MKLGFSGTRRGTTHRQGDALVRWLRAHAAEITRLAHGCCLGADTEAASEADTLGLYIVGYPPTAERWLSYQALLLCAEKKPWRPYLERNRAIVRDSDHLLAAPLETEEPTDWRAGGTWQAIRYARKVGKPTTIIWPDGRVQEP